jgi:hypothetical protein
MEFNPLQLDAHPNQTLVLVSISARRNSANPVSIDAENAAKKDIALE